VKISSKSEMDKLEIYKKFVDLTWSDPHVSFASQCLMLLNCAVVAH